MKNTRTIGLAAALGVAALALTACDGEAAGEADGESDELGEVTIGYVPWDEVMAATYLWEHILEEEGAEVELVQLEPAAVYAGVAQNDTDLYMGGLEGTHADYWESYSDDFEIVASWHEPLLHGLAVPEYVDASTLTDLEDDADQFGGRIVGIEPGSGLMNELDAALEAYDFEDYEVVEGSSAAMLAEFDNALSAEEPIVAAAWSPHWAVGEYNMQFLDDPEGVFTDGDQYHVIAGEEAQQNETLVDLLADFSMDDELFDLLHEIDEAGSGNEREGVENWLEDEDNQALVDSWTAE